MTQPIKMILPANPLTGYGYKPLTTFWEEFSIADPFGSNAIRDTYKRALKEWKNDYKKMTELVMVLNNKIWEHYHTSPQLARTYTELWHELDQWCDSTFTNEQKTYYYTTTD
ncbi:hypothetical protein ACFQY8_01010 [Alloscardovia venturai]|uniref:Uncharacterized protein n=1 Tax=Alloscardovia venturai TaxID=1769421 RepID=A0ABW2Y247_9BIFI